MTKRKAVRFPHQCLRCHNAFESLSETPNQCNHCKSGDWDTAPLGPGNRRYVMRAPGKRAPKIPA